MIWKTIVDMSSLRVRTNFDVNVYLQEQPTIEVLSKANRSVILDTGESTIEFIPDSDKMVYINMTDYFSTTNGVIGSVSVYTPISSRVDISYRVIGNVSPYNMIIPTFNSMQDFVPILPPRKYYELPFGLNGSLSIWRNENSGNIYCRGYQQSANVLNFLNNNILPSKTIAIYDADSNKRYDVYQQNTLCNRTYAAVKWSTSWGGENILTWEVRDVKCKVIDDIDIINCFNGYTNRRGYEMTLVLHLDGLTKYDYFYYSSILLSNDVRVAVNEIDADFGEETRVQVVTSSIEQPNANGMYELDIEIKYKRYDRV